MRSRKEIEAALDLWKKTLPMTDRDGINRPAVEASIAVCEVFIERGMNEEGLREVCGIYEKILQENANPDGTKGAHGKDFHYLTASVAVAKWVLGDEPYSSSMQDLLKEMRRALELPHTGV